MPGLAAEDAENACLSLRTLPRGTITPAILAEEMTKIQKEKEMKMKKLLVLGLVVALLLAACGPTEAPEPTEVPVEPTKAAVAPTEAPPTEAPTEAPTPPTMAAEPTTT